MENKSGYKQLCEFKCLVLPDKVEEKTTGGLYKPSVAIEKEQYKTSKATFIMGAEAAFKDWGGYIPQPGDRVGVKSLGGIQHKGLDDQTYLIVNDKDILGQLDEE